MSLALLIAPARSAAPARTGRPRPRTYPFAEPAGLAAWRAEAKCRPAPEMVDAVTARMVLHAVRAGLPLEQTLELTGLQRQSVMDVLTGVGSRLGQANKVGPRADACLSFDRGARQGLEPGLHAAGGKVVVVMGEGWARTRLEPRDVSRSYAATVLSESAQAAAVVDRWVARTSGQMPLTYQHLAHLYAVANGTFATLEGITSDPQVQDAYLRGFDLLTGAVRAAHQSLVAILNPATPPQRVLQEVQSSFWLLGSFARPLAALAGGAATNASDEQVRALRALAAQLRVAVERAPRAFFPTTLADLTQAQFRAICALEGYPLPDDDSGTQEGTGEHALLAALREHRSALSARTA